MRRESKSNARGGNPKQTLGTARPGRRDQLRFKLAGTSGGERGNQWVWVHDFKGLTFTFILTWGKTTDTVDSARTRFDSNQKPLTAM